MSIPILSELWEVITFNRTTQKRFEENTMDTIRTQLNDIKELRAAFVRERARGNWYRDLVAITSESYLEWEDRDFPNDSRVEYIKEVDDETNGGWIINEDRLIKRKLEKSGS